MQNMPCSHFSADFFRFVRENADTDPTTLRLRLHGKNLPFDSDFAILQIECRRKCRKKIPRFLMYEKFLFPSATASEQASHEAVALFHSSLAGPGDSVIDMTAGLGIDAMTLAGEAHTVTACEKDELKARILKMNIATMNIRNMEVVNADSIQWLAECGAKADIIFIDPARRDSDNRRVYDLRDCQPDILSCIDLLVSRCGRLIVKASPLLDITKTLSDLPQTSAIRAVSVNGECKEVLVEAQGCMDSHAELLMEAINLHENGEIISRLSFRKGEEADATYADMADLAPGSWLYEPDASVMKLSPWGVIAKKFPGIRKLDISSHLFVADRLMPDFPGRVTQITAIPDRHDLKRMKGEHANVVMRNYPLKAEDLRKRLHLKEGKDRFVYGTRIQGQPVIIDSRRLI